MSDSDYPKLREFSKLEKQVEELEHQLHEQQDGVFPRLIRLETLLKQHIESDLAIAPKIQAVEAQLQQHIATNKKQLPIAGGVLAVVSAALSQLFPSMAEKIPAILDALAQVLSQL